MKILKEQIDRITLGVEGKRIFPQAPTIWFEPDGFVCSCGGKFRVIKTRRKRIATMEIGEFIAHEAVVCCQCCGSVRNSEQLLKLVSHRCKYGFNVIVFIGRLLFVECKNEREVQEQLRKRNINISIREIDYLGKKFIVFLALAHRESQGRIKNLLGSKGGYILHLDSTVEGDSPHLMTALDEIADLVLDNIKIPSEKAEHIIPFLKRIKKAFGSPIAVTRDMGSGIASAVADVLPGVPEFICHYHWLRDIGKDLFGADYEALRRGFKAQSIRTSLTNLARQLKTKIDNNPNLTASLDSYIAGNINGSPAEKLFPAVMAYTLVLWILDAKRDSRGHGFPFDQPYMSYYQRMEVVKETLGGLTPLVSTETSIVHLKKIIGRVLNDRTMQKVAAQMKEKISVFNRLRDAMRIALPDNRKSLNDDGDDVDIKTIEKGVYEFRHAKDLVALAASQMPYRKMFKQIDKHWEKLFADPITITTAHGTFLIQPQRTNNILERLFRDIKRRYRRKTGTHSLSKTLKAMLADTVFVRNLDKPEYMALLLNGKTSLEERFAEIEAKLSRPRDAQQQSNAERISTKLKKILLIPELPQKLLQKTKYRLAA